ncbi:transcription factor IIb, putative [Plasmodium vinckei vinckei]|uniref:Transcription factor IIb, putative n=1 Tax=Plasmodium vinckei vinckei TaxID=54757 RepID=A0A449BV70_PLAVN|nr:transcription factor IIb, putative [Plasmodium vinckei vinckei]VEV57209.1 transcription factor IIb, putative [Plasmodium vinckei vinckei]
MYREKYQPKILSLLLSAGSKPLEIWKMRTKKGCVRKVLDDTIKLSAIEILSENTSDSYIYTSPGKYNSLAISLPILVLIVKNMNKYFSFRISVMDNKRCRRTFRISNFQTVTRLSNKWCTMPMVLNEGWNILQINLSDYTEKAFKTKYVETIELQINASIRIRCIYFCDRIYNNEELKDEFKIFSKKKEKIVYIPPQNLIKTLKKKTIKNAVKDKISNQENEEEHQDENNISEIEKIKDTSLDHVEEGDSTVNVDQTVMETDPTENKIKESESDFKREDDQTISENFEKENKTHEYMDMTEVLETYTDKVEDIDMTIKNDEDGHSLSKIIEPFDEEENNDTMDPNKTLLIEGNDDETDINNLTEIKNIEMDLSNVLYDDPNYYTYNNDDN